MHRIKVPWLSLEINSNYYFFLYYVKLMFLLRQSWGWIAIILSTFKTEHFKLKQSIFLTWQHKVSDPLFCSHLLATNWIAQASHTFFIWYIKSWSTKTWFAKRGSFLYLLSTNVKISSSNIFRAIQCRVRHCKEFDFGLATTKSVCNPLWVENHIIRHIFALLTFLASLLGKCWFSFL